MKVNELLNGLHYQLIQGQDTLEVENIAWDSRKVKPNTLFICVKGKKIDRHDYALQAVDNGASVLVIEHGIPEVHKNVTVIQVENTKVAMAVIANAFYGEPSKKFNLIGVTGTNGKTSVTFYVAKILETAGRKAGIIGTIENRVGSELLKVEKLNPTTPDSIELQSSFKEMLERGVTDVAMEVTSIALEQHRVDGCDFDVGVFTNLTQDHLDEHGTMENYKNAKLKLFKMCRHGVANADDPVCRDILEKASCPVITYGIKNKADFTARDISETLEGVTYTLDFHGEQKLVRLRVPGRFSVYNSLAAAGACYSLGLTLDRIVEGLSYIEGVRGRFETIPNPKGYMVVVDYAHTPDGLENILSSARELAKQRLIAVFGCGGDRDRTKRPIMGEVAGKLADFCIITSDNPRSEDPLRILEDAEAGIKRTGCLYEKIEDRKEAIYYALNKAQTGDIIVIAGKGHETYQEFKDKVIHFNDVEVVKEYFHPA